MTVRRVLVLAQDRLGPDLGGTSIRARELGRALAEHFDVSLAGVGDCPERVSGLPCTGYRPHDPRELDAPLRAADAVVSLPVWPLTMRRLKRSRARLLFDLYVPQAIETVAGFPGAHPWVRRVMTEFAGDRLSDALRGGRQFVCASEKQRDLWLGSMLADRLVTAERYDADPSLRTLIDVVPFGLPSSAPPARGGAGAQSLPGVETGDEVVLWNGGLWPWLDPFTAVRAAGLLAERRSRLRLVFMGAAPQLPAQRVAEAVRGLASELGLLDRVVFVNDRWVPYAERSDWLRGAACALSTHGDHVETRFAFRTRLLDCLWARLPIVCTSGDELAERVERDGLGAVVPAGDEQAVAQALERVLERGRDAFRAGLERVARDYAWPVVAQPLVEMLRTDPPPPPPPRARRPAQLTRELAYRSGRAPLNLAGVRDWPRL